MTANREGRIKERAYAIWESEGRPEGRHAEHWRRAAEEIAEEEKNLGRGDAADRALDGNSTPVKSQPVHEVRRAEPTLPGAETGSSEPAAAPPRQRRPSPRRTSSPTETR